MQYALIKNGIVENIIVADDDFIQTLTGYDEILEVSDISEQPVIGDTYIDQVFSRPIVIQPSTTILTKLQFSQKFTFEELIAIEMAAVSNPGIRVLQQQQSAAEFIDLSDTNTIFGVNYLVSQNLITQERSVEILTIV